MNTGTNALIGTKPNKAPIWTSITKYAAPWPDNLPHEGTRLFSSALIRHNAQIPKSINVTSCPTLATEFTWSVDKTLSKTLLAFPVEESDPVNWITAATNRIALTILK